jgi:hypothetical protein
MLTEKTIHKAGRIDQIVRDYFKNNPSVKQVLAKDLMQLFVDKGIFNKDYSRPGLPIRNLLRLLDAENKLSLLTHCKVVRNAVNRNWYFNKA